MSSLTIMVVKAKIVMGTIHVMRVLFALNNLHALDLRMKEDIVGAMRCVKTD